MWIPDREIVVLVSEQEKKSYLNGGGPIEQWPHRIGRHKEGAEFPMMAVRQLLLDQGYHVYVSGLSKVGIESYSLAMFPGQRKDRAFDNTKRVLDMDEGALDEFLRLVRRRRAYSRLGNYGGDPDLLVQHGRRPLDRFFVEVKAESRTYKDDLTNQQHLVFPLIRAHLKQRIVLAKVHILGVEHGKVRPGVWDAVSPL
jgi:hypothetical protein